MKQVEVICPRCHQFHMVPEHKARAMDYSVLCGLCKHIEYKWQQERERNYKKAIQFLSTLLR